MFQCEPKGKLINTLVHNLPLVEYGVGRSLLPPRPGFPYAQMFFPTTLTLFVTDLDFRVGLMACP
jgi:hypothetical protein